MTVTALKPYVFDAADHESKFGGNRLLYIGWEDHLMFASPVCLPLPPGMPFGALLADVLPGVYGAHPDYALVDWSNALWFKSGEPWVPDAALTLAENGLGHKAVIRFRTPRLSGIGGSCS